jgi:hypothetical protein
MARRGRVSTDSSQMQGEFGLEDDMKLLCLQTPVILAKGFAPFTFRLENILLEDVSPDLLQSICRKES